MGEETLLPFKELVTKLSEKCGDPSSLFGPADVRRLLDRIEDKERQIAALEAQLAESREAHKTATKCLHGELENSGEYREEISGLREYIDIAADVIAWLLIAAKFPTLGAVFADSDPSRLARMIELKEALLSKSSTSPTAEWCSDSDEITKAGPQSSPQTARGEEREK